jgi:C1A family cysteine protease
MKLLVLFAIIACACALSQVEYENEFVTYVKQYNKVYDVDQFFRRFHNFKAILDEVVEWNSQPHDWTKGINQFSDLTTTEFEALLTLRPPQSNVNFKQENAAPGPTVDWAKIDLPVHDQGQCGSCYAFSATEAMEDLCNIKGKALALSEQELVDCSGSYGNQGCNGGWMDYCFKYAIDKKGLASNADYPYTARQGKCDAASKTHYCAIKSFTDVAVSESALYQALTKQPISIAVCANTFQTYRSGILTSCCTSINHGVLLVGYFNDPVVADGYWKVKNSWGTGWGEQGFIRIQYGKNLCQINSHSSYPSL